MGLLSSLIFGGKRRDGYFDELPKEGGKVYKIVNGVAIAGILVALTILVVAIFTSLKLTSGLVGFLCSIVIICFGLSNSLYWIMKLEKKEYKKTSITFLAIIAVCVVLWIICLWLGISIYRSVVSGDLSESKVRTFITIIQVVLVISLQFFIASYVGTGITRYKKEMMVWQGIAYFSYVLIDVYLTFLICCFNFTGNDQILNPNAKYLIKPIVLMFFVLALVYACVANAMMQRRERRRLAKLLDKSEEKDNDKPKETTAEKLEQLKSLLDQKLITEEEYNQKREEIMKNL